jgi:hypothetical protein
VGVERAVTRWYVQRQAYLDEIASLEARLAQMQTKGQEPASKERDEVKQRLANLQARLHALGPCPKPMMG